MYNKACPATWEGENDGIVVKHELPAATRYFRVDRLAARRGELKVKSSGRSGGESRRGAPGGERARARER